MSKNKDYIIQSILIPTTNYSVEDAETWVLEHGYKVRKIHTTKDYHRFRQHTPKYCKDRNCIDVKTIPIGSDGIKFIVYYCNEIINGGGIIDAGKAIIFGIKDYSPDQKKIIEKYGANAITSIKIGRSPLPSAINAILNIVTLGAFQKLLKQSPYDKLVHLFCIITLDNGVKILLEKNERINIKVVSSYNPKNSEYVDATYIPSGLTFKELLDNGKQVLGNKYFKYDAIKSNCQDYILNVLKGSSILNDNLQQFIKQDVETIFKTLPITKKIMNAVTGTGAVVDVIKKGGATPTDPKLYEQVKTDMDNIYDKPSAYKSGAIVKEYKNRGGTYIEDGKPKNLKRWYMEAWKNVNPIVDDDDNMYPTYRPTKRISDKTPTLLQDIPIDRLKEQIKLKQLYRGDKNLPDF